jgi:N6-L-threonylcarbamoyladenine synthase
MKILGVETSCDETAAAVARGRGKRVEILSNIISSQIDIHKQYGGIVPEVAAREHVLSILPVIDEALEKAGIKREEANKKIDAIAVTVGPGLITSLQVGVETAKTLAYVWKLPIVAVNHIEGHVYANFVSRRQDTKAPRQAEDLFPAVILTVSGGHTILMLMKGFGLYQILGQTRDDAAGEAFDKAANLLGLGFPGGPAISAEATKSRIVNRASHISLPRPMTDSKDYDFSFSGLKTALLYELKKDSDWKKRIPEYAHEFQEAVVDVLVKKLVKAAKEYRVNSVMLTGGVSANKRLREKLNETVKKEILEAELLIPDIEYTTDNAAMVATTGYFKALNKEFTQLEKLRAEPNFELK